MIEVKTKRLCNFCNKVVRDDDTYLLCFECYSKLQYKYKDYFEKCKQSKKIV